MTSRLIVGLGNPGKRYLLTRHNIGFHVLERLAAQHNAAFKAHARIPAMVAEWKEKAVRWIAIKPITFMNLSGQAVSAALNFWKIELSSMLVVVDDVEVPPRGIRLRPHGSAGGHNGLKSIIEHLNTKEFARLRLGIGRPAPDLPMGLSEWVLQPFEKSELIWLEESLNNAVCAVESWVVDGLAAAMNRYNTSGHNKDKDGNGSLKGPQE